jgi:hypothetical protein
LNELALSAMNGVTAPNPVHQMIRACPELSEMGLVVIPAIEPAAAAIYHVVLSVAIACPKPHSALAVKMPGTAGRTFTVWAADVPALVVTTTSTVTGGGPSGTRPEAAH